MAESDKLSKEGIELLEGLLKFSVVAAYSDGVIVYGMNNRSTVTALEELIRVGYVSLGESLEVADIYRITPAGYRALKGMK